jgi:methylated-DNA-[protein]-cysteine S-methyltransferase
LPVAQGALTVNRDRQIPDDATFRDANIVSGWQGTRTAFLTRRSAGAASHGAVPGLSPCACPKPARSRRGGACCCSLPRRARPEDVEQAIEGIVALLRGEACDLTDAPLDMAGLPPFHRRVYETVRLIPHGQTRTHAELAARLGTSGAVHAVGQAINRNPFAILVPCHRTLVTPGHTSGFAGNAGIVTRSRLLGIEGALDERRPNLFDALLATPPRAPG